MYLGRTVEVVGVSGLPWLETLPTEVMTTLTLHAAVENPQLELLYIRAVAKCIYGNVQITLHDLN